MNCEAALINGSVSGLTPGRRTCPSTAKAATETTEFTEKGHPDFVFSVAVFATVGQPKKSVPRFSKEHH